MKIFAISDLHLSINNPKPMDIFKGWDNHVDRITGDWNSRVTDGDIVLLSGDFSWAMDIDGVRPDMDFLSKLPGSKVMLRGNHDYWWKSISSVRVILPHNVYALQNDALRIGDSVIFGTRGWTVPEPNTSPEDIKIYNRETERLKLSIAALDNIRKDTDKVICMTHYPPFNVRREDSAFTGLIEAVRPDAVVYGHLHGSACRKDLELTRNGIPYYLTSCDLCGHRLVEIV